MTKPRILIVDDAPENLDIMVATLKEFNNIVALNGEKALELAFRDIKPDLILLDVIMPGMDGFTVCQKLKTSTETKHIPIIFITSDSNTESISKGFQLGGVDYVTKPFQSDELLARVKTHLELKFSREKLENMNEYLQKEVEARTLELQSLNTELEEAKENLEQLDMAKSKFLKMISHEIRTPLNGIIGATDLMKNQNTEGSANKLLWLLDESVQRLEKFSMMALSITDLTLKKEKFVHPEKVSFKGVLLSAITQHNQLLQEKSIKINYEGFGEDTFVMADTKLLKSSFIQIIENAINYSYPNSDIDIRLTINSDNIIIKINDHGEGFSDQALKTLFEPFQPGSEYINENIGLGLHFVKLATEAQDGTLNVGNNKDSGAYVELSLKRAS